MTLCQCGCGNSVPIAKSSCLEEKRVKGQPCRFLPGHYIRPAHGHRHQGNWSDLRELYINQNFSTVEIGRMKNCSSTLVSRRLAEYNIPIRTLRESLQVRYKNKIDPIKGLTREYSWNTGLTKETDERVKRVANKLTGRKRAPFTEEARRNMGLVKIGLRHTPETKAKMSAAAIGRNKGRKLTAEHKRKISENSKRLWQNPDYATKTRAAMVRGNNQTLTKPEKTILNIINKHNLPFKYTGDGKVIIDGMNPDFMNVNGKKEVIEVFGDYWHSAKMAKTWKSTELGRIMAYKAFGFSCIILWEREIMTLSEEEIVRRLKHG